MNGNDVYIKIFNDRIENRIKSRPNISFLRGYTNSISIDLSESTVYLYLGIIISFLDYINKTDIKYEDYLNYMASIRDKTSGYQISTYSALRKLSSYLYITEVCNKDYMATVKRPKFIERMETKQKRDNNYLTKRELHKYIENVKCYVGEGTREELQSYNWKERDLSIIMLFLTTGMRCSALFKLNVNDLNFENNSLRTIDKERRIEEHFFSEEVAEVLKEWLFKRRVLLNGISEDALFISRNRSRISQVGITRILEKYSFNINGKHITPHKLRATYGTQVYEKTHDIYMVQQCMGHASPSTSSIYIRGQKNKGRQQASEIMSDLF